jgi:drug/metabolite transporter (DMT)-like permease
MYAYGTMTPRLKGMLIALFGVICVSPDAVLVRFLSAGDTDPFTIIFWKFLMSIPASATYAVYEAGGFQSLWKSVIDGKFYYGAAIPVQIGTDICFTLSFVYTSAANALLLINLNPLWCALIGTFFLGDVLPRYTVVALSCAFVCMLIIFVPEIIFRNRDDEDGESSGDKEDDYLAPVRGNIISLLTGILLAVYISIVRKGSMVSTDEKRINLVGATAIAALLSCVISSIVRKGDVAPNPYWHGQGGELWQFYLAATAQGFGIGIIFICLTVAPRLATAAEVAMVLLLEVILGPLWVFLAYGDVPQIWTIVGGFLLLFVLAFHEAKPFFERAQVEVENESTVSSANEKFVDVLDEERITDEGNKGTGDSVVD